MISIPLIRRELTSDLLGRHIYLFGAGRATTEILRRLAEAGAEEGTIVLSETDGTRLSAAALFRPHLAVGAVPLFSAIATLALAEALGRGDRDALPIWPDLVTVDDAIVGRSTAETAGGLFDVLTGEKLLAGALLAIALFLGQRRLQSPFALPGLLLTGVIAAHLALLAFGVTLDQAQAEGWMFAPQLQVALMSPWHSDMLVRFPWHALPSLFGDLLSVMFVAAITMLLNTSAVEANLDRELNSHGSPTC